MARKWTEAEENLHRDELTKLYVEKNLSMREIAHNLGIPENTVYDRMVRLGIRSLRHQKSGYNNVRRDITVPCYSPQLAEFIGILLGDGHISSTQVTVTLGTKERSYAKYVAQLMTELFTAKAKIAVSPKGYSVVYIGSAKLVRWLRDMGLRSNKVRDQVDIPAWIFERKEYIVSTIRGLIDTDGSVYKLRFGTQISFTNYSVPLLGSFRRALVEIGLQPSKISGKNVYITRRADLTRYAKIVGFSNKKHEERFYGCVA